MRLYRSGTVQVRIKPRAQEYVDVLPEKSRRIVYEHLVQLKDPKTARDIECIQGNEWRMHIAHTYTAFFLIEDNTVFINRVMSIEEAHKRYGRL